MSTVILFDIDGTLLDAAGAGRRAMEAGFAEITGSVDGLSSIRFAGMTDPLIVREGLRAAGQPHDEQVVQQVITAYLERLPAELRAGPPRVLPGVSA
ncbi:MAG: HAD family hydrolase, partial [Nannocystaceae bacterium]